MAMEENVVTRPEIKEVKPLFSIWGLEEETFRFFDRETFEFLDEETIQILIDDKIATGG